jgi:hypothetical protein
VVFVLWKLGEAEIAPSCTNSFTIDRCLVQTFYSFALLARIHVRVVEKRGYLGIGGVAAVWRCVCVSVDGIGSRS